MIRRVRKRDGRLVSFDEARIAEAIFKAACAVGGSDRTMADELAAVVTMFIEKNYGNADPGIEDIQDLVEKVLIETGHAKTAKAYILYRDRRARIREQMRVRKPTSRGANTTDMSLLVDAGRQDRILSWDKAKIADALVKEADIDQAVADEIARAVEERIFASGMRRISTSLIRELVDNELFERGLSRRLEMQSVVGMPRYDLEQLIYSKSKENSNITSNNPEAINLAIAEATLKQFALKEVFTQDVSDAHRKGVIHLHDLGYPTRVYCSSHSLEYLKKYGLTLENLDTQSGPAKHARTLTGHLNTFLASMQAYYAGALGVGYINILYAPYLDGISYETMKQEAQHLIFSGSQSAFSRGGQTLFLDFNIHTGVPSYMRDVMAIGPGGKPTGKTYGEYESVAQDFGRALLDVWRAGDCNGHVFAFPKCDFHVNGETFKDPKQRELLEYACQIAGENGSPYFIFDRDEVTLAACCRLRTTITDNYMIEHLESMRFCGFQNVTINLPQAAYRAGRGNLKALLSEIDRGVDLAIEAHLQKRRFIAHLMSAPNMPLWEIGKKARDGRPYVDLDKSTYIIGIVGLNECVQYLTGEELHEGDEALKLGLKVVSHMYFRAKEAGKQHNLKFSLEESPAESATRRLAKVDLNLYPMQAREVIKGDVGADELYYTNSVHLRANAPVDLLTRIRKQAKFHSMIESGAMIHAFVGEHLPPAESIFSLVDKTFHKTQAAQLTISPEFTICNNCKKMTIGLKDACEWCHGDDVYGLTRIVGYFSRIKNWNKSKLGELRDRRNGNYHVVGVGEPAQAAATEAVQTA
jgi:ribonucleoside-triphosphate reductase